MWKRVSDNPRIVVLAGVLLGLLLFIAFHGRTPEGLSEGRSATGVIYEARDLPTLRSPWLPTSIRDDSAVLRDPFSFQSIRREVNQKAHDLTPKENPELPSTIGERSTPKDRHPAITFEYLGYIGPFRRPFAVFRHDGEIVLAGTGQTLDGGYVIRGFDEEAAIITHMVDGTRRRVIVDVSER